jgi:diguanylate cyclase (GGDEF)-like protein
MEAVLVARFDDPRIGGILVNLRDVSERVAFEETLRHRAFHDPLTGLANRALFEDRLQHALDRTVRSGGTICVLMLDLDFFKDVNDSYGHAAGDQVLAETARRLTQSMRPEDTLARLGGDEFAVLVEGVDHEGDGAIVAERILEALAQPIAFQNVEIFLQASIGVVAATGGGDSGVTRDQILLEADLAMYEAKRQGRGSFRFFAPEMQQGIHDRMALKSDLQRGLRRGEFVLHYQPIVSIEHGSITGGEALVRWDHPQRGLVRPKDFIPMAEETGMILELGRWVMRDACREAATWRVPLGCDVPPYVSVNVAGSQLQQAGFVDEVCEALADAGLEASRLVIEVTESALIEDGDGNEQKLEDLRGLGVRLAIDDFGMGYSSLSYLRRFNMDILKIDKTFVDGLGRKSACKEAALIAAMVAMGTSLNMKVVNSDRDTCLRGRSPRRPSEHCLNPTGCRYPWVGAE